MHKIDASSDFRGASLDMDSARRTLIRRRPERIMKMLFSITVAAVLGNLYFLDLQKIYDSSVFIDREDSNTTRLANRQGLHRAIRRERIEIPVPASNPIDKDPENGSRSLTRHSSIDPYSLKDGVAKFLEDEENDNLQFDWSADIGGDARLWNLLENYASDVVLENHQQDLRFYYEDELSSDLVCGAGPGRGVEQDAGYKLLLEKIRFADPTPATANDKNATQPKLLCMVYTYSALRHLSRAQALLWGQHCDGFLAFSNETIPELGIYNLPDHPEESYGIMWQKTRKILKQAHDHFLDAFDYFYLSGDDVYLLVDNLRHYLGELETRYPPKPRHFGAWLPDREFLSGGPGYVLNRAALEKYFEVPTGDQQSISAYNSCNPNLKKPHEDRLLSQCLASTLGIRGNETDTRDFQTGAQRFHDTEPAQLYTFRANAKSGAYFDRRAKEWENQPMPTFARQTGQDETNGVVGPKHGLDAASKYSISLHKIHTPTYLARIHAILRRSCPIDSPLGRGLQLHGLPQVPG